MSDLENLSTDISLIAHCDWSKDGAKRWMSVAVRHESQWQMSPPEPVGAVESLFERLADRKYEAGAVLTGVDFPIGVPRAYADAASISDFRAFLGFLGEGHWPDWFNVAATPDEIGLDRPFYPARPGSAKRVHLLDALGFTTPDDLLRLCERSSTVRAAAASLFWTLGGNQVGKAAISGWRELIIPHLPRIRLWPFDGMLAELVRNQDFVVAETYPGDVYGQLGFPRRGWSKRRQEDRQGLAPVLFDWLQARPDIDARALRDAISAGFGGDRHGEDRFDALVGLLGMIEVATGRRREGVPRKTEIRRSEGWILGHVRDHG